MMVTFVSQCEKKALQRTRRVLDAFANRIGNNTWQTVITEDGLLTVKKMLRKTASKSTAVSCHWIRSRNRSHFLWVVGNKLKFNAEGLVPVNSTTSNRIIKDNKNDWKYLPAIRALTSLAALLHDWGKANERFQEKLKKEYRGPAGDRLRHEWVSCILLKAVIKLSKNPESDEGWLSILAEGKIEENSILALNLSSLLPLRELPPIAKLVAWLVLTHHKLPLTPNGEKDYSGSPVHSLDELLILIDKTWGYENTIAGNIESCLHFPNGLLSNATKWLSPVKRWSKKTLQLQAELQQAIDSGAYRVILHHARLCLMLGDHFYSSLSVSEVPYWDNKSGLVANTQPDKKPKQALDQHLIGVYESAKRNVEKLPLVEASIEPSYNTAELKKKSPPKYAWQDKAAQKIAGWRESNGEIKRGFFAVNLASTGQGKTFANAKAMMALSENGDTLRYILALGLRTLTLQTGDEYKKRIFTRTDGSDLGVLIGSRAILELHENNRTEDPIEKQAGSESSELLLSDNEEVFYGGEMQEDGWATILRHAKDKKMLYAPVLVCTIDHIIAATETTRGGRYILPALRLLSSDLVIDEIDDFTGADSIAIGRLIHLAGMLGRKVMISSATIPPALAEGYFNCYQEGWGLYCKTRDAYPEIGCFWIDEFSSSQENIALGANAIEQYQEKHLTYINKRVNKLVQQPPKRKADIIDCSHLLAGKNKQTEKSQKAKTEAYFTKIAESAVTFHQQNHTLHSQTGLAISFGVIRIANVSPCVHLTRFLLNHEWQSDTEVRVMAYHSKQVLLLRHEQEKHLDNVLKRKEYDNEEPEAFSNTVINQHICHIKKCNSNVKNILFIVVATPVEEVGRDHDFDWAIIEPSSYRSIIQLAGRVLRHRSTTPTAPNIGIMQYNILTILRGDTPGQARFLHPGYEEKPLLDNGNSGYMKSHNLKEILATESIAERLDATPRIQIKQPNAQPTKMALLEHAVISSQLAHYDGKGPNNLQSYLNSYWYLTALPQKHNRFRKSPKSTELYRIVTPESDAWFTERKEDGKFKYTIQGELSRDDDAYNIQPANLTKKEYSRLWLLRNYTELLTEQCDKQSMELTDACKKYGELSLTAPNSYNTKYLYNDQFGLFKMEEE